MELPERYAHCNWDFTQIPPKDAGPFPFFLDVLFQTFPVVHLPEKEGGF